jgi:phospholipase/carboxylesterase
MNGIQFRVAVILVLALTGTAVLLPPPSPLIVLRRGDAAAPTLVLLHGFASTAGRWLPFTRRLEFHGRILLPEAPEKAVRTDGLPEGRAWWGLDFSGQSEAGAGGVDLTMENPEGLGQAAGKVHSMLSAEGNSADFPFLLGGFSQGAMVACQIAFTSDEPLAALIVLSGTPINEKTWREGMRRRKGLAVFISHGRKDTTLRFDLAEHLSKEMNSAGLEATFFPFDGGHEIPAEVAEALSRFLERVHATNGSERKHPF